jgi:hypothetical protein
MVFGTDDCARDDEELTAKGVGFTEAPRKLPLGPQAQFVHPDGNLFSLSQPAGARARGAGLGGRAEEGPAGGREASPVLEPVGQGPWTTHSPAHRPTDPGGGVM